MALERAGRAALAELLHPDVESLESRVLLSAYMVKDINPVMQTSSAAYLTEMNGAVYFQANDGVNGPELWKSDGTVGGTAMVKDIYPGASGGGAVYLTNVNGTLFFRGLDNNNYGYELWKSDGTAAGTAMVKDITPGSGSTSFQYLTNVNGTLFFSGSDGVNGSELWKSDGTAAGTVMIKDITAGSGNTNFQTFAAVNDTLFFTVYDSVTGYDLWKSDGTAAGTSMVKDINPSGNAGASNLMNVNGTLFFNATDGVSGIELWKSDGTEAGTVMVKDIYAGPVSSSPSYLTDVNGTLFFQAYSSGSGYELWKSDGTTAGTVLVKDISTGSSSPANLVNVNGTLYFQAQDGVNGTELWKSDGTAGGTALVKDISPGTSSSSPASLTNVGGTLYFLANNGVTGSELWKSDGTEAGTVLVQDVRLGASTSSAVSLTSLNGSLLLFRADDGLMGAELWKSDGTSDGTVLLKDIYPGESSSAVSYLAEMNGLLFFTANDNVNGTELWTSDGTIAGTSVFKDIYPGIGNSNPSGLTNVNGTLFFSAYGLNTGYELWKSDGTAAGTVMVKDITLGSSGSGFDATTFTNVNGRLFFRGSDATHGYELWTSDGTAAGTMMLKDFTPGSGSSSIQNLTAVNDTLYFRTSDGINGYELWKSDGTEAGTVMVKDILPGSGSSNPVYLTNVDGTLFFQASDGVNGTELWKSDGTEAGTVMVKDIYSGASSSSPWYLTNVNDTLFFQAYSSGTGYELWKSDGTAAGTVLVKDIRSGGSSSSPANLVNVNGTLYFIAYDSVSGTELWKSDGTAAGTVLVKDINPGSGNSGPTNLVNATGTLYFVANDGVSGSEVWTSDGTAAGTVLVEDIVPGLGTSSPSSLTAVGSGLFFVATTPEHGTELWKVGTTTETNDAPTTTGIPNVTVNEDAPDSTVNVWSAFNDSGQASSSLTYTLTNGNTAIFATAPTFNPATGDIVLDYLANANGQAGLTVRATDNGGLWTESTFIVTVNSVNDPPSFSKGANQSVNEDSGIKTVTSWAYSLNRGDGTGESAQILNFNVSNNNAALFAVQPSIASDGTLTFTPAANAYGLATVTVTLQDSGGTAFGGVDTSAPQTFTITVNGVNDVPSFTKGADQAVNEDAGAQSVAGWATGISAGPANESAQTLAFTVSNNNASLFLVQPAIAADGTLTYTPAVNANGSAIVSVYLKDNGGTSFGGVDTSPTQTFNIVINPVNDAPSFSIPMSPPGIDVNSGMKTIAGFATAISPGVGETGQTLNFEMIQIGGVGGLSFSAAPAINPSTGTLTYTPAANSTGTATFSVTLHDNGGTDNGGVDTSAAQIFSLAVNPIPVVPTFSFGPQQVISQPLGPTCVVAVDIDGDSHPDAVSTGSSDGTVGWQRNLGDGTFGARTVIDSGLGLVVNLTAGDIDGDGQNDVVVGSYYTPIIAWYRNLDGLGTFGARQSVTTAVVNTHAITAADLDRDGDLDLLTTSLGDGKVAWYENMDGHGAFGPQRIISIEGAPWGISVADMDGDGDKDVVTDSISSYSVAWFENAAGDQSSWIKHVISTTASEARSVYTADMNQDGRMDVISASRYGDRDYNIAWYENIAGSGLNWMMHPVASSALASGGTSVLAADMDNDGRLDLVSTSEDDSKVAWYRNLDGLGTFGSQQVITNIANHVWAADVADLDGDGDLDVLSASRDDNKVASYRSNLISAPTLSDISRGTNEDASLGLAAGDFDGAFHDEGSLLLQSVKIISLPSHGALMLGGVPVVVDQVISRIDLSSLSYMPANNYFGSDQFSWNASNGALYAVTSAHVNVTIAPMNDAPSFVAGPNMTVNEGSGANAYSGWASSILAGPSNETGQLTWFETNYDHPELFMSAPVVMPDGTLQFSLAPYANGMATVTTVLHDNGGAGGGNVDESAPVTFTINVMPVNDRPAITSAVLDRVTLPEGGAVNLSGGFFDPDVGDAHSVTINWGDGGLDVLPLGAGVFTYSKSHTYLDNNSGGVPVDVYAITVTVSDATTTSDVVNRSVTVSNVNPITGISGPNVGVRGQPLAFTATASDPGVNDAVQVAWDFGDGVVTAYKPITDPTALNVSHAYANNGAYLVKVLSKDKDGGTGSASQYVVINMTAVVNGVLYVGGTAGNDYIGISTVGVGQIGIFSAPAVLTGRYNASKVVAYGNDGNDTLDCSDQLIPEAELYGGNGNDLLRGGTAADLLFGGPGNDGLDSRGGADVLVGGEGNDIAYGGDGRDVLIGGGGFDSLYGNSGEDMLIAGRCTLDNDIFSLKRIRDEWASARSYSVRQANIRDGSGSADRVNGTTFLKDGVTLFDDNSPDWLTGGYDPFTDWFFANTLNGDLTMDRASNETLDFLFI